MEKKEIEVKIDDAIALCHIIKDFDNFDKDLFEIVKKKNKSRFIYELGQISDDKFCISTKKESRNFYKTHKKVIDEINKYSNIRSFIWSNYADENNYNEFFILYDYITNNIDKLDKILKVLNKIKSLGFYKFNFNEEYDFTKENYEFYKERNILGAISYLDNIKTIPTYKPSHILYKTENSNYKIDVYFDFPDYKVRFFMSDIHLNDLTFDENKLPSTLSKENIYDSIIEQKAKHNKENVIVENSVALNISIEDLMESYKTTEKIINNVLHNVEDKQELINLLNEIKNQIIKMQYISEKYDEKVIEDNELITKDILDNEKKLYKHRRFMSSIDSC